MTKLRVLHVFWMTVCDEFCYKTMGISLKKSERGLYSDTAWAEGWMSVLKPQLLVISLFLLQVFSILMLSAPGFESVGEFLLELISIHFTWCSDDLIVQQITVKNKLSLLSDAPASLTLHTVAQWPFYLNFFLFFRNQGLQQLMKVSFIVKMHLAVTCDTMMTA